MLFMNEKSFQKFRAFTLIEVVIGVTIMSIVIVAVAGLVLSTLAANRRNIQSVQAVYLAEDGVEIMRYIRDSNWLQNYSWDGGEKIWSGNFGLDDFDDKKTLYLKETPKCPPCWGFSQDPELITLSGGVQYERSIAVKRVIDEDGAKNDGIYELLVRIQWEDKGKERSYVLSTYLSNWK